MGRPVRRAACPAAVASLLVPFALVATGPVATASGSGSGTPAVATYAGRAANAVTERKVIGRSVRDRKIWAYRLGEPDAPEVVLISTMHGDEGRTRAILRSLRDGSPIHGLDLWVVPTYNPDGLAAGTRKNARGVDLNRNYPHNWADLDGSYESGPGPASEPETRAMIRFLKRIRPARILSFHQPLHGVDTDTKNKAFARKVARKLVLPRKTFDCGGVCHGTMTSWYNAKFRGAALTVEYGADPTRRMMRRIAPRRVLSIWGGHRGDGPSSDPASSPTD